MDRLSFIYLFNDVLILLSILQYNVLFMFMFMIIITIYM